MYKILRRIFNYVLTSDTGSQALVLCNDYFIFRLGNSWEELVSYLTSLRLANLFEGTLPTASICYNLIQCFSPQLISCPWSLWPAVECLGAASGHVSCFHGSVGPPAWNVSAGRGQSVDQ